jgi:hypothetical protein
MDFNNRVLEEAGHEVYVFTFGELNYSILKILKNPKSKLEDEITRPRITLTQRDLFLTHLCFKQIRQSNTCMIQSPNTQANHPDHLQQMQDN